MVGGLHIALCVLAIGPPEMFSSFSPSAEAHRLVFHHHLNLTVSPVEHTASSRRFADCSAGVQDPSRKVCCNAACGLCGGRGCSGRPGGPRQCCVPAILSSGRVCESRTDVACILRGSSNYIGGDGVEHHSSSGAVLAAAGGESTQSASRAPMKLHPRLPPIRVKRTTHAGVTNATAAATATAPPHPSETPIVPLLMRVVLYVTTHLSDAHAKLLLTPCWGDDSPVSFRRRHPALSAAHLHFFVPAERVAWLRTHFPRASVSSPRAGTGARRKQDGAIEAMANPSSRRLFRDFDWVIRLNPDVAVLDFSPFYAHMVSGRYDAVVGTCPGWRVLTDFTVFRPQAIDRERVDWTCPPNIPRPNAECEMTHMLRNASLAGRVKVVYRTQSTCRITWSGVVLHSHGHREECSTSNSFYLNATRPGRR
mmetsp:Transcript_21399/g.63344  ORF Transcript_21399/g.63344 Transcript_21399/m.63344 type:complete len:423 (-) Transcript_21399:199-1467(-)